MNESNARDPFYLRLCASLISICLILLLMYLGKGILVPIALATIFSIVLISPCNWLERKGWNKHLTAAVVLILALCILTSILLVLSIQVADFKNDIPKLQSKMNDGFGSLQTTLKHRFHLTNNDIGKYINELQGFLTKHSSDLVGATFSTVSVVLMYCVFVPIYAFLFLIYRTHFVNFLIQIFDNRYYHHVKAILFKTKYVIRSYVVGLLLQMVLVSLVTGIVMFILGVKYAILLALITGILNVIPYLGIFSSLVLSCLITFTTNDPNTVLGVAISIIIIHIIDSNIIMPSVVGSKVKINSLITILAVIVGENIWGIPGMFLSVPIVAILKVIFDGVDYLKPWGYLLGDGNKKGHAPKAAKQLKRFTHKQQ